MKTVISGKDGVGKALLTAFLSHVSASSGFSITAIDAIPDVVLATAPGFTHPEKFTPILELNDPIEECVGVLSGASGSSLKLDPIVNGLPDNYSVN